MFISQYTYFCTYHQQYRVRCVFLCFLKNKNKNVVWQDGWMDLLLLIIINNYFANYYANYFAN